MLGKLKNKRIAFIKLSRFNTNQQQSGFTLLELMVTLVIIVVLLVIAVPSFQEMIASNRTSAHAQDIASAFVMARSEAIKRGTAVSICPSSNGTTCSGNSALDTGWIIFIDSITPGTVDNSNNVTAGGDIIFYHNQLGAGQISASLLDANNNAVTFLRFSAQGFTSGN